MVDRRNFIRSALGAVGVAITTPIWVPPLTTAVSLPERTIFAPPVSGWFQDKTWHYPTHAELAAIAQDLMPRFSAGWVSFSNDYVVTKFELIVPRDRDIYPGQVIEIDSQSVYGKVKMMVTDVSRQFGGVPYEMKMRINGIGVPETYQALPVGAIRPSMYKMTRSVEPKLSAKMLYEEF